MSLAPQNMFWARFVGSVFGPTVVVLVLVVAGHWNKTVVELANVPMAASTFVWVSIILLGSNSLLFGGRLALWLRRRGSLSFASYEDFASRAVSFASRSLAVVWVGIPVAGYLSADPENAFVSAVIAMLFGIAYQSFIGFPVLFGTVFFVGWAVFQKTETA
jgi:hypothetical protein